MLLHLLALCSGARSTRRAISHRSPLARLVSSTAVRRAVVVRSSDIRAPASLCWALPLELSEQPADLGLVAVETATAVPSCAAASPPGPPGHSATHGPGLGKTRWAAERTLPCLHHFKHLRIHYETHADPHPSLTQRARSTTYPRKPRPAFLNEQLEGAGLEVAVKDADETIAEMSEGEVVADIWCTLFVVATAGAERVA